MECNGKLIIIKFCCRENTLASPEKTSELIALAQTPPTHDFGGKGARPKTYTDAQKHRTKNPPMSKAATMPAAPNDATVGVVWDPRNGVRGEAKQPIGWLTSN